MMKIDSECCPPPRMAFQICKNCKSMLYADRVGNVYCPCCDFTSNSFGRGLVKFLHIDDPTIKCDDIQGKKVSTITKIWNGLMFFPTYLMGKSHWICGVILLLLGIPLLLMGISLI